MPDVPATYFDATRRDLLDALGGSHLRVLEIGCGTGATGVEACRRGLAREYVGVELDPDAAAIASERLSRLVIGDVERMDRTDLGTFDAIVAGDVIEHLVEPWGTMRDLVRDHLRPNGQLVASIPNARCYAFWAPLVLRGRFDYTATGLRDRTHLRWFTRHSMEEMLRDAGLDPAVVGVNRVADGRRWPAPWIARALGPFGVVQYVVKGVRRSL